MGIRCGGWGMLITIRLSARLAIMLLSPQVGAAGPFDSTSLQPGVVLIREESLSISPHGGVGANLSVPGDSTFTFDYSVESGKEALITMLTKAQYEQLVTNKALDGAPLMRITVSGVGTQSTQVSKGDYLILLYNMGATGIRFSYCASYKFLCL